MTGGGSLAYAQLNIAMTSRLSESVQDAHRVRHERTVTCMRMRYRKTGATASHRVYIPESFRAMQKKRLLQVVGVASGALLLSTVLKKRSSGSTPVRKSGARESSARKAPADTQVWVNTERGVYHQPDTRWYGKTANGEYMSEKAARQAGFKPAARSVSTARQRTANT